MRIAVIGTGYVGLVSGVCLASKRHIVTCFDINKSTIDQLSVGRCPIYEPGLEDLLRTCSENIRFRLLDNENQRELMSYDAIFVAVGTPTLGGKADLSQIESVARMMGRLIKDSEGYISVIIKSTVVPGTTDTFVREIIEQESGKNIGDFGLGMNPEFLREGCAVGDFQFPDRIVLGFEDSKTLDILKNIYKPWSCEKIEVNARSAEMMKYVNNAILATLISTVNEYSNIARKIENIDFQQVMHGVHLDNRWSPSDSNGRKIWPKIIDYLKPGCGYGGSCFPKDVKAILALANSSGVPAPILSSVIDVNDQQPSVILEILRKRAPKLKQQKVLLLGLSFKPDTDDIRESVSIKLLNLLSSEVASLYAHDPIAIDNSKRVVSQNSEIGFVNDWRIMVPEVHVIIIATNWPEYTALKSMSEDVAGKIVFDTRSLLSESDIPMATYLSVN